MLIPLTLGSMIRCLAAFTLYLVWPGLVMVVLLHGKKRSFHLLEELALALGWSAALNSVAAYGTHFAGGTLTHYAWIMVLFDILGTTVVAVGYFKKWLTGPMLEIKPHYIMGPVLLLSIVWFGVILQNGPRVDYYWDQWFHIAHVREVLENQCIVPSNPMWEDVLLSETYGAWHPLLALIARTADVDLMVLWRVGNALMAGLSVIVVYVVANWIVDEPRIALLSAVVFLGGGVGLQIMRTFLYPWGISSFCLWMGLGMFFRYLKTGDWLWALSAIGFGFSSIAIHPQEFIFFCFSVFVLGVGLLIYRMFSDRWLVDLKRIALFFLVLILIGLPLVLIKYPTRAELDLGDSGPVDISETSSDLFPSPLAKVLAAAFPYFGKAGALFVNLKSFNAVTLILLWFLPKSLDPKIRWFLITMTCAPFIFAVVPGFSWLATLVLRETYAWRLLSLVPNPIVWSLVIFEWLAVWRNRARLSSEDEQHLGLAWSWIYFGLAIGLIGVAGFAALVVARQENLAPTGQNASPLESRAMFEYLDQASAQPAVVLSDPQTSYAIPALTKHHVVLNEPSHGSRDDIVTRFADARALLSSPSQSRKDAWATIQQYGVDFILINKTLLDEQFFTMTRFYSTYTLDFLRSNPACFELLYDDAKFELFSVSNLCAPAEIVAKGQLRQKEVSFEEMEYPIEKRFSENLSLLGFSLPGVETIVPGRVLNVDVYWQAEQRIAEPYYIILELLGDYPGCELPYGKLLRKIQTWRQEDVFAVRDVNWLPVPPSGFSQGEVFVQSFELEVPANFIQKTPTDLSVYVLSRTQALSEQRVLPIYFMELEYIYPGIQLKRLRDRH